MIKLMTRFITVFLVTVKYRHPAAFFNPSVRLSALVQALEGINYHYLDVPEGCHLHPNVEVCISKHTVKLTICKTVKPRLKIKTPTRGTEANRFYLLLYVIAVRALTFSPLKQF